MRLLHIFPELGTGGSEKVILQISKFVIENTNAQVGICTTDGIKRSEFESNGIKILNSPSLKNKFKIFNNIISLNKNIKTFKPDIVHTHTLYSLLVTFIIKKLFVLKFPIVHTGHGGPRKNYNKIASFLTKFVDIYISISPFSYDFLKTYSKKDNIRLIPNGIDTFSENEVFKTDNLTVKSNRLKIAFIGRIVQQKGLEILIDSVSNLINKKVDVELMVIGDGELKKELEKKVDQRGLNKNIRFLGYHSNPWILSVNYPIVVMPSLWEPGGLVALEAISRNHTLIASKVEGLKDSVIDGKNGYLFEPGNVDHLTNILYKVALGDKSLLNLSKDYRMQYLFEKSAGPEIYKVYSDLIGIK